MKKNLRVVSVILLFFTTISAVFGGWMLISEPDGSKLQMSAEWLTGTPFNSYLIPGIILLLANGILSLFTAIAVLARFRIYPLLIILQSIILCGWIISQISLIRMLSWLQIMFGFIGVILFFLGLILLRGEKSNEVKLSME